MISVSYTNSIYDRKTTINKLDDIKEVDFIHLDLMDGIYVDKKTFEIDEIIDLFKNTSKDLDIHLMVKDPAIYIDKLSTLNPKYITFHPDATMDPEKVIDKIKSYNIKCGIAINSFINIDDYSYLYDKADLLLIMSVKAGLGGQEFLEETYDKLDQVENIKDNHHFLLEIDGGINISNIKMLKDKYPIDIFVVGSYICMNENFERPIIELKNNL